MVYLKSLNAKPDMFSYKSAFLSDSNGLCQKNDLRLGLSGFEVKLFDGRIIREKSIQ